METLEYKIVGYVYKGIVIGHTYYGNEGAISFSLNEKEPVEIKLEDYSGFGLADVETVVYLQDIIGETEDGRRVVIEDNEIKAVGNEDLIDKYMDYFFEVVN